MTTVRLIEASRLRYWPGPSTSTGTPGHPDHPYRRRADGGAGERPVGVLASARPRGADSTLSIR